MQQKALVLYMFVKDSVSNMKKMWTHLRCVVLHVELDLKLVLIVTHFHLRAHVRLPGLQRHRRASVYTASASARH